MSDERRTWWIYFDGLQYEAWPSKEKMLERHTHEDFTATELLPGDIVLSREMLREAIEQASISEGVEHDLCGLKLERLLFG